MVRGDGLDKGEVVLNFIWFQKFGSYIIVVS